VAQCLQRVSTAQSIFPFCSSERAPPMAPLITRTCRGLYAARSFIVPQLRITIGHFRTRAEAVRADATFQVRGLRPLNPPCRGGAAAMGV